MSQDHYLNKKKLKKCLKGTVKPKIEQEIQKLSKGTVEQFIDEQGDEDQKEQAEIALQELLSLGSKLRYKEVSKNLVQENLNVLNEKMGDISNQCRIDSGQDPKNLELIKQQIGKLPPPPPNTHLKIPMIY